MNAKPRRRGSPSMGTGQLVRGTYNFRRNMKAFLLSLIFFLLIGLFSKPKDQGK